MEEVRSRQFHVLHTHPNFHSSITTNAANIKSALQSWKHDLAENEIAMHGRPIVQDVTVDNYDPLFDKTKSEITRTVKNLSPMKEDPLVKRKKNITSTRYYSLRGTSSVAEKAYLDAITARGAHAAIEHLDTRHVFAHMYASATLLQAASFKRRPKVEKKEGKGLPSR